VLEQIYSNWELIIVNDGSTDHTASIIAQFTDPRIKVVHQLNGGEAAARNTALNNMKGDFIAFLDADDIFLPNHLATTVAFLQNQLDRDAVYTDGYYIDLEGKKLLPMSARRRGPFEGDLYEQLAIASDVFGPPGCVVLRSESVKKNNLWFDTDIGYGTDWDFWIRLSTFSQFGYLEQSNYLYRVHPSNLTLTTNARSRSSAWAKVRSRAIKMERFKTSAPEVRWAVFYNLLVNLLDGSPEAQTAIIDWPEFMDLPAEIQAKLLRLMASKAIVANGEEIYIRKWISLSRELNPSDRRGKVISSLYNINPVLCRMGLGFRSRFQTKRLNEPLPEYFS
jgi:glycosyltransferase involved in cell wall biosynthesis